MSTSLWITTAIGAIPAGAAISSAVIAARSARSVKRSESEAQRIRDLENRISERKYQTYQPVIQVLGDIFDPAKLASFTDQTYDLKDIIPKFMTWITIYGSDDAVRAYRNFMQASFNDVPPFVMARLVAEFIIAARRDIGYPNTQMTAVDVLGMRISDIYLEKEYYDAMTLPFAELCKKYDWNIPWQSTPVARELPTTPTSPTQ